MSKQDIYGWKCRLIQIEDMMGYLEQQKLHVEDLLASNKPSEAKQ